MIKNLLSDDEPEPRLEDATPSPNAGGSMLGLFDSDPVPTSRSAEQTDARPDYTEPRSLAEGARGMGLAYSAGIAFTAAVVFMLVLGWGADVLLGTSPWGIVAGIVLGSIIGFVQFFRITSQIFKK